MTRSITRRDFVAAGVGALVAPAVLGASALAQGPVTVEQFLALSKRLTGAADLDPGVARTLLDGLLASGGGSDLAALLAGADGPEAKAKSLADAIVASWYSGVYDNGHGEAVATFDQALLWDALSFTKPFGSCGGEVGYWSGPPEV